MGLQGGVGVSPASLGLPPGGVGVPPASLGLPPGGVGVAPANDARYPPRRADRCRRLAAASSARALQAAGGWGYESGPWGQDPNDAASPGPLVVYGANPDLPPILLLHVGERWYQPDTGRFIQRDPIGLEGGINLYSYCDSEPLTTVDPEGLAGGKKSIDKGILRFGPSKKLVGYRKWTHPWTLRYKTHHFYGWRGWVGLGGLVCIAWDVGYGAGTLLDELHPWTDRKWHEHIGEWLYWEAWRGGDVERQGDGNVWY